MTFVTFGASFVESGRFVREGRTCNTFSIVKYILFVSIRTVNGHSVREWRASLFFRMVKLDDFIIFLRTSGSKMVQNGTFVARLDFQGPGSRFWGPGGHQDEALGR